MAVGLERETSLSSRSSVNAQNEVLSCGFTFGWRHKGEQKCGFARPLWSLDPSQRCCVDRYDDDSNLLGAAAADLNPCSLHLHPEVAGIGPAPRNPAQLEIYRYFYPQNTDSLGFLFQHLGLKTFPLI